jgi:hypothetical protein
MAQEPEQEAQMTNSGSKWLGALLALVAVAFVAIVTIAGLPKTGQVLPFKVDPADVVHLSQGAPISLKDPDPDKVYEVEAGAHVSLIRSQGDPLQLKQLRLFVDKGGTLEGAEGTNVYIIALDGSVAHVGQPMQTRTKVVPTACDDGLYVEAFAAEVYAQGTTKVKALSGSVIHNTSTCEEHAYDGSVTYARMRGRVFANAGSVVYTKSPENCDACSQVEFAGGSTIYIYDGAEAFGRGSSPPEDANPSGQPTRIYEGSGVFSADGSDTTGGASSAAAKEKEKSRDDASSGSKRTTIFVYDGGEVGCYKYCTVYLWPKAEFHEGAQSVIHKMKTGEQIRPFPDGDADPTAHLTDDATVKAMGAAGWKPPPPDAEEKAGDMDDD